MFPKRMTAEMEILYGLMLGLSIWKFTEIILFIFQKVTEVCKP